MTLTAEQDSIKGYEKLKTAKEYGYENKPCDICDKVTGHTRFWGGTSVLVCGGSSCNEVMNDRWEESTKRIKEEYDEDYYSPMYGEEE